MAKVKSPQEKEEEARRKAEEKQRTAEQKARAAEEAARRKQLEELLEPLRRALAAGDMPLYATAKNPGLFAGKSKKIAEQALQDGLIELVLDGSSGKRAAAPAARLTEKGRRFVLEEDSPKKILEELVNLLKKPNAGQAAAPNPLDDLNREITKLGQAVNTRLAKMEKDFQGRLDRLQQEVQRQTGTGSDGRAVHDERVQQAVKTVEALAHRLQSAPPPANVAARPADAGGWSEDLLRLLREQKQRNAHQQLSLPQIYERLKSTRPGLTLGQFHDGLRTLQDQKRIRLGPYTQGINSVPDNRNALYLDQELKFYVDLHEGA